MKRDFRELRTIGICVLSCCFVAACCDLEIVSSELPEARVGEAYDFQFDAECDDDRWELVSGDLPPGLSLSTDGELNGIPALAGTFVMSVSVGGSGDSGEVVSKGFSLIVIQPVGALAITVTTSGANLDPDGFTLLVDNDQYLIGVNETLRLPAIPVGTRTVALGGLSGNCSLQNVSPQTVTVTENDTTNVTFQVACTTPRNGLRTPAKSPGA